ncbi:MAG: hypothetical protein WAM44_12170, partial [Chthoniobacterales bacterium]
AITSEVINSEGSCFGVLPKTPRISFQGWMRSLNEANKRLPRITQGDEIYPGRFDSFPVGSAELQAAG